MLIFDLESDGLLDELTRIHTLHMYDTDTGKALRFNDGYFADGQRAYRDGSIDEAVQMLMAADEICGHNIIGFDLPAITKLYPEFDPLGRVHDTMIYTRLIWPHLKDIDMAAMKSLKRPADFGKLIGSHSLKAWGIRLGVHKGDYEGGWQHFTQEMEEYAEQDVVVTKALWELIESKNPHQESVELEHQTAQVIAYQERFGFGFNVEAAERLEITLRGRKAELEDQLRAAFPPWEKRLPDFIPKRDNKTRGFKAGVPVKKFKTISFNPASRDHIADRLKTVHGWEPIEFTETGKPKVDETTLGGLDFPEAKLLVEYLTIDKRLGQVAEGSQAWLKRHKNGRMHGRVNTLGAVTRRMTHSYPNVAQVPSVGAPYGKECRSLFHVGEGNKIVGCDAEGLELRMLAHYMAKYDGGKYADTVVNGQKEDGTDVHSVNQRIVGLNSRNSAKTFIYAYLYGAGNLKLGSVIYDDMTEKARDNFHAKNPAGSKRERALIRLGTMARKNVEQGLPALGKLQDQVKRLANRKYLKTVDGGNLRVRSPHAALNTLLQGGGAVVMKKALVIFHNQLITLGFRPNRFTGALTRGDEVIGFLANVHDEFQTEVPSHLAEKIGQIAADSIRLAGVSYSLRCPLAGAFEIGETWADSH